MHWKRLGSGWTYVRSLCLFPSETYSGRIKESPTLDLVNDCSRFVITFFELINTSAPHIYHSAIFLSPRTSIVRRLYGQYACPLARVVRGSLVSWEPTVATVYTPQPVSACAWSLCGRFIAVGYSGSPVVEILDAATLRQIKTFTPSSLDGTGWLSFSPDGRLLTRFCKNLGLTSWDLQTGGPVCAIPSVSRTESGWYTSSTCSTDGKMVAVSCSYISDSDDIHTYNLVYGRHVYSHRASEGRIIPSLWTHDERLRFATAKPGYITIWEAEFASIHTLTEVETLPLPDGVNHKEVSLFLPTRSLVGFVYHEVVVWDARGSKPLLKLGTFCLKMEFSPDGQFFACGAGGDLRVLRESPTGYVPHQELAVDGASRWRFSPNGESIIMIDRQALHLWHTKTPTSVSFGIPGKFVDRENFILGFSTDGTLAAVTRVYGGVVTILDLESGEPWFTIDAGMKITGLRVTAGTIVVVGGKEVVTWNLPAGNCDLNTEMNTSDSVRSITLDFRNRRILPPPIASMSPDLNYIAIWMLDRRLGDAKSSESGHRTAYSCVLYDLSTGKRLATIESHDPHRMTLAPWVSPDSREVWFGSDKHLYGHAIVVGDESGLVKLDQLGPDASPSGGFPWESSRGYEVTHGGWVLSPLGRRLLWLPHSWRSDNLWTWQGRFLGLFHRSLPEVVILEFYE